MTGPPKCHIIFGQSDEENGSEKMARRARQEAADACPASKFRGETTAIDEPT
jgi:hypothetical protein